MSNYTSALIRCANEVLKVAAWATFIASMFVATFVVLEDFPKAEGKLAGLTLISAAVVVVIRGLVRLKSATLSEHQRYGPGVQDALMGATIAAAVLVQSQIVHGRCFELARAGTVVTIDCGYGPISFDSAGPHNSF